MPVQAYRALKHATVTLHMELVGCSEEGLNPITEYQAGAVKV